MKKLFFLLAASAIMFGTAYADTVKIPHNPQSTTIKTSSETLPDPGLSINAIDNIMLMVEKDSAYKISVPKLCNGAIKEIREYLKSKRLYKENIPLIKESLSKEEAIKEFNSKYTNITSKYASAGKEEISYAATRGLLKAIGDPYALFMDPKAYKAFNDQMKGSNFGGIGVYVKLNEEKKCIDILEVMEDNPADSAGLKKGDAIIKIDNKPVSEMESLQKANESLRGQPGTEVIVTVKRGTLDPFNIKIKRDIIKTKSVSGKMIDGNIGYVRMSIFAEKTGDEIRKTIAELERNGAQGFIIDLRGNGGGYVTAAIQTVSLFVPTRSNVVTLVKEGIKDNPYLSIPNSRYEAPPIDILIDKGSASASEITSGALQDHEKAELIGTISYGKASVQKVYPLDGGTGMKFTTSHYVTPKRRHIDKVGITPDIEVKLPENKLIRDEKDDVQLQAAIKDITAKIENINKGNGSSMEDAVKSVCMANDIRFMSIMFPDGYEIKKSEIVINNGNHFEHYTVESKGGTRSVWFRRGSICAK